ncbi:MAG: tyrosine-type recombinase/integrase [Coriobacteriia bacterium]|nr:tyrosine-type recombinase/integrase [Coriobacteriia bacterium]
MASGTLVRRGDSGVYHMVYRDPASGRQVWRSTGTNRRREAERQLVELRHRLGLEGESHRPSRDMEFGRFVSDHWLPERCGVLKDSTQRQYAQTAKVVVAWLGSSTTVRKALTVGRAQAYVAYLAETGRKPSTIRNHLALISSMASYAVHLGYLDRSPIGGVAAPRVERPEPVAYTAEEMRRILAALPRGERDIAIMLFALGLRRSELSPLVTSDYVSSTNMVGGAACGMLRIERRAWRGKLGTPKTGVRVVPIGGVAEEVVRRRSAGKQPGDLLFPSERGRLIDWDKWARTWWLPALRRAGVTPMGLHAARRTAITLTLASGTPIQVAARRFGASAKTILAHYASVDREAAVAAATAVEDAMAGAGSALQRSGAA